MDSLLAFVEEWTGYVPSWYGVADEKLSATPLPKPLHRLYGTLGNMPGREGRPFAFSGQDTLLPFEWLRADGNRILFAVENQGCWRCFTDSQGDDPPVWIAIDDAAPELAPISLANFLVTLCLQEITMGAAITYAGEGMVEAFSKAGFRVTPLWLHGRFPCGDEWLPHRFHLVEGGALVQEDHWVSFRFGDEEFSAALGEATRISPCEHRSVADRLYDPSIWAFAKKQVYERLARDHQQQADLQQSRADECRRLAEEVMKGENG